MKHLAGMTSVACLVPLLALITLAQNSQSQPGSPAPAPQSSAPSPQQPQQEPPPTSQPPIEQDDSGGFVFKKEVEEVVLHAIVIDRDNHLVTNLAREDFAVFEDGKPQVITSFRHENVPVALGILIDNSGSMRPKRASVNAAALHLVEGSRDHDQVFIVNFGEDYYLDQDFTSDVAKLKAALERVETQGSTALYDAIVASAKHLNQGAPAQKKVLLVVTDGRDNASQESLQEAMRQLQTRNGPVLYVIALQQSLQQTSQPSRTDAANQQALTALARATGGTAFFPASVGEVSSITQAISRDIRSQYVIGYKSSNPGKEGAYHAIQVRASDRARDVLRVSTRSGYYTGSGDATH